MLTCLPKSFEEEQLTPRLRALRAIQFRKKSRVEAKSLKPKADLQVKVLKGKELSPVIVISARSSTTRQRGNKLFTPTEQMNTWNT